MRFLKKCSEEHLNCYKIYFVHIYGKLYTNKLLKEDSSFNIFSLVYEEQFSLEKESIFY